MVLALRLRAHGWLLRLTAISTKAWGLRRSRNFIVFAAIRKIGDV
jgi:hypothetical protein